MATAWVQDVFYNVSDMARAVSFYTHVLGLGIKHQDDWWTALDAGGVTIGLHWSGGSSVPTIARDAHGPHAGATLTLRSTDIAADRKTIEKAGCPVLGEFDEPWGHLLVFEDPDGNVLKLMKPKS
jgi:predicted enzyme related to lactoylglutathione lyase